MRVNFKCVKAQNFLSIDNIELEVINGITSIAGKNLTDGYSESNGSGKSSIIEALVWCITGSTSRGISSDSVINNQKLDEGCKVLVELEVDKDLYHIIRTRGGKFGSTVTILKNGEDISGNTMKKSQSIIEELIPLNYEDLTSCIILAQDMPGKFSSLTPAGRKSKLEKIANYDSQIDDLNNMFKEEKKAQDSKVLDLERKIDSIEKVKIPMLQSSKARKYEELQNHKREIEEQDKKFAEIDEHNNSIAKSVESIELMIKNLEEQAEDTQKRIEEISKKAEIYENSKDKYDRRSELIGQKQYREGRIKDSEQVYKSLGSGVCLACGRPLDNAEEIAKHKIEILESINLEKSLLQDVLDKLEVINKEIDYNDNKKKEIDDESRVFKGILDKIQTRISSFQRDIITLQSKVKDKVGIVDRTESIQKEIDEIESEGESLIKEIDSLKPELDKYKKSSERLSVIVGDISRGQFRTFLLDKTMKNFNNLLSQISKELMVDEPVRLLFDGNRIEIVYKDKFYEQMSGGEKKRIDIALELTVRKYKSLVSGVNFNLLVMDETFDSLDKLGIDSLFNAVEASGTTDSFVVISHREDACLNYDRKIVISKVDGLSKITEII